MRVKGHSHAQKSARIAPESGGTGARLLGSVWGNLGDLDPLRFKEPTPK